MNFKYAKIISALLFAATGVVGAWIGTYAPAAVFALLYLVFLFVPIRDNARIVLLIAASIPVLLAASSALFVSIEFVLLLVSLLLVNKALKLQTAVAAVIAGVVSFIVAFQSSAVASVIIAVIATLIGAYILFIVEYRIRKQLKVNTHEN